MHTLEPGWFERVTKGISGDIDKWPNWMKRAGGLPVLPTDIKTLLDVKTKDHYCYKKMEEQKRLNRQAEELARKKKEKEDNLLKLENYIIDRIKESEDSDICILLFYGTWDEIRKAKVDGLIDCIPVFEIKHQIKISVEEFYQTDRDGDSHKYFKYYIEKK